MISRTSRHTPSIQRRPATEIYVLRQTCLRCVLGLTTLICGCRKSTSKTDGPAIRTTIDSTSDPASPPWFADITTQSKLHFVHDAGPIGKYFFPQIQGSGAALFDYDNDGRLDMYLVQNGGPDGRTNQLFHQETDGTFKDVSEGSGLDIAGYGMGVAIGDVNNDGLPDVLVTEYRGVRLFLNLGRGKFADITRESGLNDPHWAMSAAFVDYDRDGWLDLLVTNYVEYVDTRVCNDLGGKQEYCGPTAAPPVPSRFFHNLGSAKGQSQSAAKARPAVRFEDVSAASGIGTLPGPALGVTCLDFDGDGWPDILVTDDAQPNRLWINRHIGKFQEEALLRGIAYNAMGQAPANMGIAVGDVEGSGLIAVLVPHLSEEVNALWTQVSPGVFADRAAAAGLAAPRWRGTGFGAALCDFRNRGTPDLAVTNGAVKRPALVSRREHAGSTNDPAAFWRGYAERNQLFANDGTGNFRDVSTDNNPFCGTANVGRGLAWGDFDNDGGIDLLTTCIAGPARLFRNVATSRGHWLVVRAVEPALGGRDAYGAVLQIRAGGRSHVAWVNPGSSYLCSNDPRAHVGLGSADRVEAIRVTWPEGDEEDFPGGGVDRVTTLKKGEGMPVKSAQTQPHP